MSDSGGAVGPGWMHAEGDPPGTQRYWDGNAWQGEPQPAPDAAPAPPVTPPPAFAPPPSFTPPPSGGAGAFGQQTLAEPAKKRSVWKWVVGVILLAVLGIGGCSYALFRAVSGPIDVGNEFLAAIEARDFDQAWAVSDPSCFEGGSPEQLAGIFANDEIVGYRLSGSSVNSNNGVTTGSTSGTVTLSGDDERSVEIIARKRGDDWLVCGFDIAAADG